LFQKQFITSHAPQKKIPKKLKQRNIRDEIKNKGKKNLTEKKKTSGQLSTLGHSQLLQEGMQGVVQDFSTNSNANSSNMKKRVVV